MKEKEIKVLKVEPMKVPEVVTLKNELHELQKAVSIGAPDIGLIEIIELNDEVCILCNEEGKLIGLPPNRRFRNDILVGVFYVTGQDYGEGELISLPEHLIEHLSKQYAVPDIIDPDEVEKTIISEFYVIYEEKTMIYKLGNVADMSKLPSMDDGLRNAIFKNLKILDDNYGEDRDIDNDDGRYVLYCEPGTTEEEIMTYHDYIQYIPEHALPVISNPPYIETLYLISSDYGIVLFTKYADTPDDILEEMDDE